VVRAVREDGALRLDFNHPLAGQPVTFEVHLIGASAPPMRRRAVPRRRRSGAAQTRHAVQAAAAEPRGFCAGVDRAIEIVERALAKFGAPIYVRHEIVHNTYVVNDLKAKGAIFIEDLAEVPPGATLVFSAHGVPKAVEQEAERAASRSSTPPARW
jgi:hypothetical protein